MELDFLVERESGERLEGQVAYILILTDYCFSHVVLIFRTCPETDIKEQQT
jgi:hypothetical protein